MKGNFCRLDGRRLCGNLQSAEINRNGVRNQDEAEITFKGPGQLDK